MLAQALSHSLATYLARDGEKIVGLVRLVGDGFSSVFVQDLIVLPSYQRRGIGSNLMKEALADYKDAYQIQLATEQTEKTWVFTVLWGLKPYLLMIVQEWFGWIEKI